MSPLTASAGLSSWRLPKKQIVQVQGQESLEIECPLNGTGEVRANIGSATPQALLGNLALAPAVQFEPRSHWMATYTTQVRLAGGLTGLLSSRAQLLPDQIEVIRRALRDPVIRYLLADEVGLGKTIEAGVLIRQFRLRMPDARIGIFVPAGLEEQWREKLRDRFGQMSALVYTQGSVDFYRCYPGLYAPRTLDVQLDHAESGAIGLLTELLALTKMNWNSAELINLEPITLSAARSVGSILRHIPPGPATQSRFSYFM